MKVEIINGDQVEDLFSQWSQFASVCYNSTIKNPEAIGKHCYKSGHFSGSRSQYINFVVSDCPRNVIDQIVRHEQGVCKNVQSFRYVEKNNFSYEIPKEIKDNEELLNKYVEHMNNTAELYDEIYNYIKDNGKNKERASEQARYVLPMATYSAFAIGFTVEAFIHLCHMRLCVRTEDTTRKLVQMMREEVVKVLPYIADDLVPQCKYLLWCPEVKSCGAYPSKSEVKDIISKG